MKLTTEINSTTFLDTQLNYVNGIYKIMIQRKAIKLPTHRSSKVPQHYKQNNIFGDLYIARSISTDIDTNYFYHR